MNLLKENGYDFHLVEASSQDKASLKYLKFSFSSTSSFCNILRELTNQRTVPNIWVQGTFVGGNQNVFNDARVANNARRAARNVHFSEASFL